MPAHLSRAVWLLGLCQCVLWGVLYYSFSVFLVPMEHDLGLSGAVVAGAFSLGLFVMASSAPRVGRLLDLGHAALIVRGGILLAVTGLVVVSQARNAITLYAGWLLLGLAMATLLYESTFVLIIRAVTNPLDRMKALAAVTVMGGLASSIFLPTLSYATERLGWQRATLCCAVAVLIVAWIMERSVLPTFKHAGGADVPRARNQKVRWPAHLRTLATTFVLATSASMVVTILLIPLLQGRGAPSGVAALVLGTLGVAQLPGRVLLLRNGSGPRGRALMTAPIILQAVGLVGIALTSSTWTVALGVGVFGMGAGLQTLARPWLVQALYGSSESGRWNGELARVQGYARAIGPVTAATLASWVGAPMVLLSMSGLLALSLPLVQRLPIQDN
ncbi:MFS transporter [Dyella solisilvae]|uniref:MFS transporter n=1 Tax=Dyella solisilvae TaxID=1920168 RepID=UPI0026D9BCC5